jgi:hypothetical protein
MEMERLDNWAKDQIPHSLKKKKKKKKKIMYRQHQSGPSAPFRLCLFFGADRARFA